MPIHFSPRTRTAGPSLRREPGGEVRSGHPMRRAVQRKAGHPLRIALRGTGGPLSRKVRDEDQDLKLFVLSFTAFFICFATFLF